MECPFYLPRKKDNRWYVNANTNIPAEEVIQKALEFDFNKHKKLYEKTFETKLMEIVTNELGNPILPCAVEVIILQFRKFMGVLAYNSMYLK